MSKNWEVLTRPKHTDYSTDRKTQNIGIFSTCYSLQCRLYMLQKHMLQIVGLPNLTRFFLICDLLLYRSHPVRVRCLPDPYEMPNTLNLPYLPVWVKRWCLNLDHCVTYQFTREYKMMLGQENSIWLESIILQ